MLCYLDAFSCQFAKEILRYPGAGIHSGNPTGQPVPEASKPLRTEGLAVLESDIADAAKSNMHGGQGLRYLKNTLETCS